MTMPGPWVGRAAGTLAGAAVLLVGLAGMAPAPRAAPVTARLGPITVTAAALHAGPMGTLTASVQVSTSGQFSDQLDAAIAAGGLPVAVYHQRVAVGELTDLATCDGATPPVGLVDQWLHEGPLLVPGRSGGSSAPATATLTIQPGGAVRADGFLAVTLYFAQAGALTLRLPVAGRA